MRARFSPKGLTEVEPMSERGVHRVVDLRSDTVTRPSQAMRRAMMLAEVGDDVYGEDPTVNRLEAQAAQLFEREAAVFVPTGTMANQIAIRVHTQPGQEVVCESRSHLFQLEMGMAAAFSGCLIRPVTAPDARLGWSEVQPALRLTDPYHRARTGLVVQENTHNLAGGVVTPAATGERLCRELRHSQVASHLDGARIFNAAEALGASVVALSRGFDTVMFCLSKGLGAPVGSLLLGSQELIHRARIARKMMGGGMRQAGVLAAAGLVALSEGPSSLAADHARARWLAQQMATMAGLRLDPAKVDSNIVLAEVHGAELPVGQILAKLAERNVLGSQVDETHFRFVTHRDVDQAGCEEAAFALRSVLERG